jgi:hypothetical protein
MRNLMPLLALGLFVAHGPSTQVPLKQLGFLSGGLQISGQSSLTENVGKSGQASIVVARCCGGRP